VPETLHFSRKAGQRALSKGNIARISSNTFAFLGDFLYISEIYHEIHGIVDSLTCNRYLKFNAVSERVGEHMTQSNDKREKFIRLAEGRTQSALDAIRKLGNLSNGRAYEYDDADVKKIMKALRDAMSDVEKKFGSSSGDATNKFKL